MLEHNEATTIAAKIDTTAQEERKGRTLLNVKLAQWHHRVTSRTEGPLSPRRATARLSAYVYGNILTLASVALATAETVEEGTAVALVAGTAATTFVAHIFAEIVAHASFGDDHEQSEPVHRVHILEELRDAVPIATSAAVPSVLLALGWWGVVTTATAQLLAGGIVVFRIATIPIVTERIRGNPFSFRLLAAGIVTAAIAATIVVFKVSIGH